jgi:hypothetical protein
MAEIYTSSFHFKSHTRLASNGRDDHITVTIVQVDATPTYDLILPANFAEAFLDWLKMSAAEFGYEFKAPI